MKAWPIVPAFLLGACQAEEPGEDRKADANQIARLAEPSQAVVDVGESARLQPLGPTETQPGPGCDFEERGRRLLTARGGTAMIRLGGKVRHLVPVTPVGATGGFFEDRQLSVSIGRDGEPADAGATEGSWAARLTVTNRLT